MVEDLGPLHEKRAYYTAHPDDAMQVLVAGSERAQQVAQQTMAQVRDAAHLVPRSVNAASVVNNCAHAR